MSRRCWFPSQNGWTKGCTHKTRYTSQCYHLSTAAHRVTQLGVQFFQISNDGESWETLKHFDDNLRTKHMLGRVRLVFDRFVLANANVEFSPLQQDMVDAEICNHSEVSVLRLAKLLLGPINKQWDGKVLPPDEPCMLPPGGA